MSRHPLEILFAWRETAKLAYHVLAGALELDPLASGVPIRFLDRRASLADECTRALERSERVLVGWSFYSPSAGEAFEELRAVRATLPSPLDGKGAPRILHLAGGVHASAEPLATLAQGFDLVAVGEGERIITDLVRALLAGADPGAVQGITSRGPSGVRQNGRGEPIELDAFPPFAPGHGRLGPIEITRGCIYACKFCQTPYMNKARFRHRSVENVARWVEHCVGAGFRDFRFLTPTSMSYGAEGEEPALERVEALLRETRRVIGPARRLFYGTFPSEIRPEHVTPEALALIARHCDNRSIIVGGQSGSDRVLLATLRGHDAGSIERAVETAIACGFEPHVDFIFGLPGEETADVDATILLAERLSARGARIHGHTFMPLPGTPLRDAPPGDIAPDARRRLERLTGTRRLYGEWQRQACLAREIAARRKVAMAEGLAAAPPRGLRALPVVRGDAGG